MFRLLPFIRNGSDVIYAAKLDWEKHGQVFPSDSSVDKVLIFGNSKILAGFVPEQFDHLAQSIAGGRKVSSFNSGFPGSDLFLEPLRALCERGQAPNVLLMTLPWNPDPPPHDLFHFIADDHAVISELFPFRNLPRDLTAFLLSAPEHGGVGPYYREAEKNQQELFAERGYHLITEQSRFPGGRLPDDFHLASDQPGKQLPRTAPLKSSQLSGLNELLGQYHIQCFYVPFYLREGEAAPAAPFDRDFAARLAKTTSCRLLGPNYYLYPNRFFADQTHLNHDGAAVYTQAIFELLKGEQNALQ